MRANGRSARKRNGPSSGKRQSIVSSTAQPLIGLRMKWQQSNQNKERRMEPISQPLGTRGDDFAAKKLLISDLEAQMVANEKSMRARSGYAPRLSK